MAYPLGAEVELIATFNDVNGLLADPSAVTLYVRQPGQVDQTAHPVTRQSLGVFVYQLQLPIPGRWLYCWEGTGNVQAATFDIPLDVQDSALRES